MTKEEPQDLWEHSKEFLRYKEVSKWKSQSLLEKMRYMTLGYHYFNDLNCIISYIILLVLILFFILNSGNYVKQFRYFCSLMSGPIGPQLKVEIQDFIVEIRKMRQAASFAVGLAQLMCALY